MYSFLTGKLYHASPQDIVLDVAGVGYHIFIPASLFGLLPALNEIIRIHTSLIIRENCHSLYGFLTPQDRNLFEALLNVTGIGPKTALSLIGHLSVRELQHAILNHEVAIISKVPGIGKKTAERLIIDLRDKIQTLVQVDPAEFAINQKISPETQVINDAMSALINLGYNQNIAQKAIKKSLSDSNESIDLATLITTALKNI